YEAAGALLEAQDVAGACQQFAALYDETLAAGWLPLIDDRFRTASLTATAPAGHVPWAKRMSDTSAKLMARKAYAAAVMLAWQCCAMGDSALGDELLSSALAGVPEASLPAARLAAVECLASTGRWDRADALMAEVLTGEGLCESPWAWRLGAYMADRRGRQAVGLRRMERAMEIEYAHLPDVVNLQAVRADCGGLLNRYEQLAKAIATLEEDPPEGFLGRVVRAADRWRAIDPDDTQACQAAARIFQALDAPEVAWEYLTTPLALRPNEAGPWTSLASELKAQGELHLAERAYASAFEAERTNAQILWDRAQVLQQIGRTGDARALYRQIAEGTWPRQFSGVQSRARQYLEMR
ncbi:MAG TPA: hypothetical protein VM389_03505, partial [Phycisphaerae bacterium]|nr:hypothetical protein [Phycisphaerae bacterium]